jgi:hypothetical protein
MEGPSAYSPVLAGSEHDVLVRINRESLFQHREVNSS